MKYAVKLALGFVPWFLFIAIYFYYPFSDELAQLFAVLPLACLAGCLQVFIWLKFDPTPKKVN